MKRIAFAVALSSCLSAPSIASAQIVHESAGDEGEIDCDGGSATITGASNTMTVTGHCTELAIEGASNRVHVDLAPKGVIRVVGAGNQVQWTTPDGSKARVRVTGAGNRVSMAR